MAASRRTPSRPWGTVTGIAAVHCRFASASGRDSGTFYPVQGSEFLTESSRPTDGPLIAVTSDSLATSCNSTANPGQRELISRATTHLTWAARYCAAHVVRAPGVSAPPRCACPELAALGRDDEGCDSAGPAAKCAMEVTGPVPAGLSRSSGHISSQSSPCVCGVVISRSPAFASVTACQGGLPSVLGGPEAHISRLAASKRSRVST
jgi:hypothetical protein